MYRYPIASSSTYTWKELLAFCQNPTSVAQDIPPPPDFWHLIIAKLAGNPQLLTGVMVLIMMLGAFIAAAMEHFVPPQKKARPVQPPPGDKTLKAE